MEHRFFVFALVVIGISACSMPSFLRAPSSAGETSLVNEKTVVVPPPLAGLDFSLQVAAVTALPQSWVDKYKIDSNTKAMLESYLAFLQVDPHSKSGQDLILRLLNSSLQFLVCKDFRDWSCLEKSPDWKPVDVFRQEVSADLGQKLYVPRPLKLKAYLTDQWDLKSDQKKSESMLVHTLSELIRQENWSQISMALYGMDDLQNSMRPLYEALLLKMQNKTVIKAVFDLESITFPANTKVVVSHWGPGAPISDGVGLYSMVNGQSVAQFQYPETVQLIEKINQSVGEEKQTLARLEWPLSRDIMHNKFFIFKSKKRRAVWTGTANLSQSCMGLENNANMGVLIEDPQVADIFQTEFDEMFDFQKQAFIDKSGKLAGLGTSEIPQGRFHRQKRPNTRRYLSFSDGHELKIHFSPTDDGEHRSILPMIYSARPGDEIRIAMFGSGGVELIRALQWAASQGVQIRILLDFATSFNPGSWVHKKSAPKLQDPNPYAQAESPQMKPIEIRFSKWNGMNHHKTATLTRVNAQGQRRAEVLIVGSQNWSASGNDDNDENMLTLRQTQSELTAAAQFNRHFDSRLWTVSQPLKMESAD